MVCHGRHDNIQFSEQQKVNRQTGDDGNVLKTTKGIQLILRRVIQMMENHIQDSNLLWFMDYNGVTFLKYISNKEIVNKKEKAL